MVDVQQPTKLMRKKEQQSVSIPCSVNVSSCQHTPQISWYVFRKDYHYQIDVSSQPLKYKLDHHDLEISSLSKTDCGVYYCAAALLTVAHSGAQAIGQGTTLKVSGKHWQMTQSHPSANMLHISLSGCCLFKKSCDFYPERGLNVRQVLLLTLLILLTVYSLLVLGIIICIKVHLKLQYF